MNNPNGDDFVEDNPLAASAQFTAGEVWKQTKEKSGIARERAEVFVRENPLPLIVGALVCGLAVGWALRHATQDEKEIEAKTPLGDFNWSFLSLPFLWPLLKSVREKYEDSSEAIKDNVRKIDIDRYAKPLRKRWKSWTH